MTDQEKIQAIADLLNSDAVLATKNDQEIADALTTISSSWAGQKDTPVNTHSVRALFLASTATNAPVSSWATILRGRNGTIPGLTGQTKIMLEDVCATVYEAATEQEYLNNAAFGEQISAALTALESAGIITEECKNAQLALAYAPASWSEINIEGRAISAADIAAARELLG